MGLEDQAAVRRVAGEFEDVVVLLGTPDVESTRTLAETVVTGDPSFAGPLAGVPLGLPVVHILEPAIKAQIPPDVFEAQVALMELSLDTPGIVAALSALRKPGASGSP
jgi:glycine reductase